MESGVKMQWGVKIRLRDGVHLNATLYLPRNCPVATPAIVTMTPYVGQTYHDSGVYFAENGYPFLIVDVRGRGNSEGVFRPNINEARDGHDVVEWLAIQPYCNGQVAMWGGSYAGYSQWAAAKEFPPHLATIVPAAAPYMGLDFPMRGNISWPYLMKWLTLVSGRTSQDKMFWNSQRFWGTRFREWFESGAPFKELDTQLGNPSSIFQEWVDHPEQGAYWDGYNPTADQYAKIDLPILTITGACDVDQLGALMHYREHMRHAADEARKRHYLVVGPWDHAGTRFPQERFAGLTCGSASLVNLPKLHLQWYAWTMQGGPKPEFMKEKVAYYVMGAEEWRYAQSLEEITERSQEFYLRSVENPTDLFRSGTLDKELHSSDVSDCYVHDPSDISLAELESSVDPDDRTDERMVHASIGKQLIYHGAPFETDTELSGFFRLTVWLAIDQPDTDVRVCVYRVGLDGRSLLLTDDSLRMRYRTNPREARPIETADPLPCEFAGFRFVSYRIAKGERLRLVIGPLHSIYSQKNYNTGGVVSAESAHDARTVTVRLFHDKLHPSVLYVPLGYPQVL